MRGSQARGRERRRVDCAYIYLHLVSHGLAELGRQGLETMGHDGGAAAVYPTVDVSMYMAVFHAHACRPARLAGLYSGASTSRD